MASRGETEINKELICTLPWLHETKVSLTHAFIHPSQPEKKLAIVFFYLTVWAPPRLATSFSRKNQARMMIEGHPTTCFSGSHSRGIHMQASKQAFIRSFPFIQFAMLLKRKDFFGVCALQLIYATTKIPPISLLKCPCPCPTFAFAFAFAFTRS